MEHSFLGLAGVLGLLLCVVSSLSVEFNDPWLLSFELVQFLHVLLADLLLSGIRVLLRCGDRWIILPLWLNGLHRFWRLVSVVAATVAWRSILPLFLLLGLLILSILFFINFNSKSVIIKFFDILKSVFEDRIVPLSLVVLDIRAHELTDDLVDGEAIIKHKNALIVLAISHESLAPLDETHLIDLWVAL